MGNFIIQTTLVNITISFELMRAVVGLNDPNSNPKPSQQAVQLALRPSIIHLVLFLFSFPTLPVPTPNSAMSVVSILYMPPELISPPSILAYFFPMPPNEIELPLLLKLFPISIPQPSPVQTGEKAGQREVSVPLQTLFEFSSS